VVAGDRDRVEFRHLGRGELDDVGDDPHRGLGRVDIGVADHELLEDVVLHRAGEVGPGHTLFLSRDDEHRQHRDDGAVHGHRHAHLGEWNAIEQDLHVLDRIDRHAGLADVAGDPRVVGIIAPVGGEIEGHRQALLPGGQVLAVERVAILRRREAGILPDGPGLARIHGRAHAAGERREARQLGRCTLGQVFRGVERLQRDAFRRRGVEALDRRALEIPGGEIEPVTGGLGLMHNTALHTLHIDSLHLCSAR